jgi:hypothetical protein
VLDSGPAPEVEITSPSTDTRSGADLVTVAARIKDRGKGIGRIEWREWRHDGNREWADGCGAYYGDFPVVQRLQ